MNRFQSFAPLVPLLGVYSFRSLSKFCWKVAAATIVGVIDQPVVRSREKWTPVVGQVEAEVKELFSV